ncbi:hypothetical protein IMG5_148550 [Ichthyophthirius multifiliis]|uniref:Uncharacterized protein n=1 Tax=Ichthyophthirius multifiliis TaxID=5932 RepID=G0QYB1_ICHMU|nr:hypothetical protein IMG5_148550 [Ichthyophthirius multifiliis]EGR29774.1 hypothetical protein IMG5_148550 [Ichthyophthirius multifiliis]|eukprot:XP_004031010.1 hypothetical protein IMG5_148550 [Ichthyophthirius multifiliis]
MINEKNQILPLYVPVFPFYIPLELENGVYYIGQWKNKKRSARGKQLYGVIVLNMKATGNKYMADEIGRLIYADGKKDIMNKNSYLDNQLSNMNQLNSNTNLIFKSRKFQERQYMNSQQSCLYSIKSLNK